MESMGTTLTLSVICITCFLLVREARAIRTAAQATAFKAAYDMLYGGSLRYDHTVVFRDLDGKPLQYWMEEEIEVGERVCESFDAIGKLCRLRLLSVAIAREAWGEDIRRAWQVLSPLISTRRNQRNGANPWKDFEFIARVATA
jgi:hypothetical protein